MIHVVALSRRPIKKNAEGEDNDKNEQADKLTKDKPTFELKQLILKEFDSVNKKRQVK